MKTVERNAVSTAVAAIGIIVALVVAGAAGYYVGTSGTSTHSVSTTTITAQGGGGATSTTTVGSGATGGAASTVTTTVSATGSALQTQADLAKAECAKQTNNVCLTIYSTVDSSDWTQDFAPEFFSEYPWAAGKVNFVGLSAAQVQSRAISEYKAGQVQADFIQATEGITFPIILAGAIQNYTSPNIAQLNYTKDAYDPNGAFTIVQLSIPVITYNPQQMQKLNLPIPKAWSDLGNPVYKSHIGFQTATSLSATTGIFYALYDQMGNSSWMTLMKNIAANQPVITASASDTTNNIVAGKVALGIGLYNDYLAAKSQANTSSSVSFVLPAPAVYNPVTVLVTKNAPHPQMARLMVDWQTSISGQVSYAISQRAPYQKQIAQQFGLIPQLPAGQSTLQNSYANPAILTNPGAWSDTFKSIFGA